MTPAQEKLDAMGVRFWRALRFGVGGCCLAWFLCFLILIFLVALVALFVIVGSA